MVEIFILSLVQGITEFLPISSSSHLILTSKYLNFDNQGLTVDVSLHIGSFLAVIFYFKKDLFHFIKTKDLLFKIIFASLPVMFVGFVLIKFNLIEYIRNIKVIGFPLNDDFATFKNNLKEHAKGMFIFQIDADEIPHEYLIENMHLLLDSNKDVDLFFVPRVNTVEGLTDEHIKKWGWRVNENGWVNWPDVQTRLYRRTSEIQWVGTVHEKIVNYNTLTMLPFEEQFSLYHPKDIDRQEKQNDYYETL